MIDRHGLGTDGRPAGRPNTDEQGGLMEGTGKDVVRAAVADLLPLSAEERDRKRELERVVDENMVGFVAVGEALAEIRTLKLYRPHETFEEYVAQRFEMSRRRAYQLMAAAAVVGNVNNCAQIAPANEAQVRPLTLLPEADQPAVWGEVVTQTGGMVTAKAVREAVLAHLGQEAAKRAKAVAATVAADPDLPDEFREPFARILEFVRQAREQARRDALRRYIKGLLNLLEN
jgi:Arc/MetJ-type ribon-helix-helix transcriptional regulator